MGGVLLPWRQNIVEGLRGFGSSFLTDFLWIPTDFCRCASVVCFTAEVRPLKKLKLESSAAWPAVQVMAGAIDFLLVPGGQKDNCQTL